MLRVIASRPAAARVAQRGYATGTNTAYLAPTHLDTTVPTAIQSKLSRYASVSLQTYARPPFILAKGKNCTIWDTEGRAYLDFSGGIAVNALGHSDEGVHQVVQEQSKLLIHNSNLWHNEWSGELALLLVEATKQLGGMGYAATGKPFKAPRVAEENSETAVETPSSGLKVFFSNSGTEANEGAIKFARKWGKQQNMVNGEPNTAKMEIVSFADGFHGRSMGALSATWQDKYQLPFAPLVPGFVKGDFNNCDAIQTLITERTCAVMVEPIQGEGGITPARNCFLRKLRARCDEVGALLIFDEIQCGLGRTGAFWAHSDLPVNCHPDIVTMAKPLANGIPIGAILMKDKVADIIKIGDHGTTFGGGPLQSRVAHHVLHRMIEPSFLPNVQHLSTLLLPRLARLQSLFPRLISGPPRGRGLILGLPFHYDALSNRMMKLARERGLLILTCGKSTIRLVPSLTVSEEEVGRCMDVIESCLNVMEGELGEGIM